MKKLVFSCSMFMGVFIAGLCQAEKAVAADADGTEKNRALTGYETDKHGSGCACQGCCAAPHFKD